MKIGIVGCSKRKAALPGPAREVYSASPHFRAALIWAEAFCSRTLIVSAKYGLLKPEGLIAPYYWKPIAEQWGGPFSTPFAHASLAVRTKQMKEQIQ